MGAMPSVFSDRPRVEEVAPDVYRIDLCMPAALGPTNSYLFKADGVHDQGRSLIVDTGCNQPVTREAFDAALAQIGIAWEDVDVFITHFHWDHCAGLTQIWRPGMTVFGGMARFADRRTPIMAAHAIGTIEREISVRHGVNDVYDPEYWAPMADSGHGDYPLTVVGEGDVLRVGRYELRVLETPGHDMHHRCLYDPAARLFIAGDQVLYSMYTSVTMETSCDQMAYVFNTLERLAALDADLVLCGHGEEGRDLSSRCRATAAHYRRQLMSFLALCEPGLADPGELAYRSTEQPRRTSWADRTVFGRRALLGQTMVYLKHLVSTEKLPDIYPLELMR